jgi:hypothetical protein
VDSKIRWHSRAWGVPAEPFEKRTPYDLPDTGACLILVSLLSLGLWAAIWGIVGSLTLAVFG